MHQNGITFTLVHVTLLKTMSSDPWFKTEFIETLGCGIGQFAVMRGVEINFSDISHQIYHDQK